MGVHEKKGFSLVELLVTVAVFTVVSVAGMILFSAGQSAWSTADAKIELQENARQVLLRLTQELQESGDDENGLLKVSILDGSGVNNSDILRFSVPICPCGTSVMDEDGNVKSWGAPLTWGRTGCGTDYSDYLTSNGKVEICHLPPGNPANMHTLRVSENAVKAHLAHGDWLGDCDDCDPTDYDNKTIEYLIDNNNQLLRRVLNASNGVVNSVVFAQNVADFQVSLNLAQTIVTVDVDFLKNSSMNRLMTKSIGLDVPLRN